MAYRAELSLGESAVTLLFSATIVVLVGYAVAARVTEREVGDGTCALVRIALTPGIGFGLSSIWFFAFIALGVSSLVKLAIETVIAIVAFAWLMLHRTFSQHKVSNTPPLYTWAAIASIGGALAAFLIQFIRRPLGISDAFGLWNAHARIFDLAGRNWLEVMRTSLHPDYPGLLPLTVVRFWQALHGEATWVPAGVALTFLLATAAVIFGAITTISGRMMACAALVSLFANGDVISLAANQYADVPLAYYYTCAVCLVLLGPSTLPLAGLCAGLAAWTKNEGLLFSIAIAAGLAVVDRRSLRRFLPSACVGVGASLCYKWIVHVPSDLFTQTAEDSGTPPLMLRVVDLHRMKVIASSFTDQIVCNILPLAAVVVVACSLQWQEQRFELTLNGRATRQIVACCIAFFITVAGYAAIYLGRVHTTSTILG
jgi:hypothetical protein